MTLLSMDWPSATAAITAAVLVVGHLRERAEHHDIDDLRRRVEKLESAAKDGAS